MLKRYYAERVITNEEGFPTLILTNGEEKGPFNEIYLTPFRGYSFQVSKTIEGEMNLGDSEVVGLGNIISPSHQRSGGVYRSNLSKVETEKYLFELLAKDAIEKSMNYVGGEIEHKMFIPYEEEYKLFKEFIDLSHSYILQKM